MTSKDIAEVSLGGPALVNADGIVLQGNSLYVVQNFTRQISELRLSGDWAGARVVNVTAMPSGRTFTTLKLVGGRLLVVDSKFGFAPALAVGEVRVVTLKRF